MNKFLVFLLICLPFLHGCDEDGNPIIPINSGLTNEEIILGLKEALTVGTDTSVNTLNKANGYFADQAVKILLPDEISGQISNLESQINGAGPLLKPILQTAYSNTISPLVGDMVLSLNRAAEDAAVKAKPIFVSAITGMTISDGLNILQGSDTAATSFLRSNTYSGLFSAFQPSIDSSLSKDLVAGKSANDIFNSYVTNYNSIASSSLGLVSPISSMSLSEHTTSRGLNGLFMKVAEEETEIRNNPLDRVTDLLERVFGGG